MTWFDEGSEDKSWCSKKDAQSHTHCSHPHTHFLAEKKDDRDGAVVCDSRRAATCALAWVVGAVQDQKANATLTKFDLDYNNVGDAGATALAEAVRATVLTCKKCVFRASVCCHRKCRFTMSSEELASSTCCAGCVAAFVILLVV